MCLSRPQESGDGKGRRDLHSHQEGLKDDTTKEQYHEEDQKVWLTTALTGLTTAPDEEELKSVRDIQLGRHTDRHLHPVISVVILKIQEEISTQCQNRSPSSEKIRVIEIEKEHSGHTHG